MGGHNILSMGIQSENPYSRKDITIGRVQFLIFFL
jgi:hypothetical protein